MVHVLLETFRLSLSSRAQVINANPFEQRTTRCSLRAAFEERERTRNKKNASRRVQQSGLSRLLKARLLSLSAPILRTNDEKKRTMILWRDYLRESEDENFGRFWRGKKHL